MKYQMIQADIDEGIRKKCDCCPIANTIKRYHPEATDIMVASRVAYCVGEHWHGANAPENVIVFINDFDDGRPVSPIDFELEMSP